MSEEISQNPNTQPPNPEQRLRDLGIELPPAPAPVAAYAPTARTGSVIHISGQLPLRDGRLIAEGLVPDVVDEATARACARQCVLNGLAALRAELETLDRVLRVVRLGCFVAASPSFGAHPKIADGASELLVDIFGEERGLHARAAVGCASLPLNAPVEIEMMFDVF